MQPNESAPASTKPAKNATLRYVISLTALVAIVGGIAWVIQYLPSISGTKMQQTLGPKPTQILSFKRPIAQFGPNLPTPNPAPDQEDHIFPKDVELGTSGHYDFPFKNVYSKDVDILGFSSACSCNNVKAAALGTSEWQAAQKHQDDKPAEPILYAKEPDWYDLPKYAGGSFPANGLRLKPDDGGLIRVSWEATKSGPELRLRPKILLRCAGDPVIYEFELSVPVMVRTPIQFDLERLRVGLLAPGKSTKREFDAWSSTRDKVEFKIVSNDPLFTFTIKRLEKEELAEKAKDLRNRKLATRVLSAFKVVVKIHESDGNKHLDQGSYYRKFPVALDGNDPDPNSTLFSPEIIGRVKGDIGIGGEDDLGRIRFAPFTRKTGGAAEVQLSTSPKIKLEKFDGHRDQPSFLVVNLTRDEKQASPNRVTWHLEAIVPPNTSGARSFDEPDAVVLRIHGTDTLVRIPLEGLITR